MPTPATFMQFVNLEPYPLLSQCAYESLSCLQDQARVAERACVSDDDVLEKIAVGSTECIQSICSMLKGSKMGLWYWLKEVEQGRKEPQCTHAYDIVSVPAASDCNERLYTIASACPISLLGPCWSPGSAQLTQRLCSVLSATPQTARVSRSPSMTVNEGKTARSGPSSAVLEASVWRR